LQRHDQRRTRTFVLPRAAAARLAPFGHWAGFRTET
jgi:hypothetical protein